MWGEFLTKKVQPKKCIFFFFLIDRMEGRSSDGKIAIEVKTANRFLCPICMEFVPLMCKAQWTSCKHMYLYLF